MKDLWRDITRKETKFKYKLSDEPPDKEKRKRNLKNLSKAGLINTVKLTEIEKEKNHLFPTVGFQVRFSFLN